MLGHAITTELQLLAAREHAAILSDSYGKQRRLGSDDSRPAVEHPCVSPQPAGRPAAA
jgi:hypothetical protein